MSQTPERNVISWIVRSRRLRFSLYASSKKRLLVVLAVSVLLLVVNFISSVELKGFTKYGDQYTRGVVGARFGGMVTQSRVATSVRLNQGDETRIGKAGQRQGGEEALPATDEKTHLDKSGAQSNTVLKEVYLSTDEKKHIGKAEQSKTLIESPLGTGDKTPFGKSNTQSIQSEQESPLFAVNTTNLGKLTAQAKNANRPPLSQGESYVTYDPDVVVRCHRGSPYVACDGDPTKRTPEEQAKDAKKHPPYKVFLARNMRGWLAKFRFSKCAYNNCISVKTLTPDVDHLHFFGVGFRKQLEKSPKRYPNQTWSFGVYDTPPYTNANFLFDRDSKWNYAFNMTMSYRLDSDVFVPYGVLNFQPAPLDKRPNYLEIAKNKTKTALWFVSHCDTLSNRTDYYNELKKYIDVEVFGKCGKNCTKSKADKYMCDVDINDYHFYLSFENSLCNDYVTEKYFKFFYPNTHIIPVTRGLFNYTKYFPANTFVDSANFENARELGLYLKSLSLDPSRYAQMLEQKDMYRRVADLFHMWCYLCKALNTQPVPKKNKHLKSFWITGQCKKGTVTKFHWYD